MILNSAERPFTPAQQTWLITCMACVVLMVFIGGVTRLTESGLSIVEWKLVTGIFPPMTQAGWEAELQEYRASPEYQQVNKGMSVAEFKQIYWLEWLHRLLGRLTGLVFLLPLIYFAARRTLAPWLTRRMVIAGLLVLAQGTLGWLMVYSGLQDDPRVSPLRLAAHLSLAFFLFCWLYITWLDATHAARPHPSRGAALAIRGVIALLGVQIVLGAFVAGMDAGLIYNTWPLMDGDWVPPHLFHLEPWYRNLIAYIPMVQWQHRSFAYVVSAAIIGFILWQWRSGPRFALSLLALVLVVQFKLGVLTLIHAVPIALGSAHQMVALLLLAISLHVAYRYPLVPSKKSRID